MDILVVDDNEDLAVNLADILEEEGNTVSVAFDGESAIELARSRSFDLALLDYKLPDMDGLELQEQLSELIDADYLIITAHASIESASEAVRRKQVVGYEPKPLDMDRLLAFVRQIGERRKAEILTQKARDELNFVFDKVRTLIWQKNVDGRYVQANKAFCNTVGLAKKSIIGKTDYDLFSVGIANQYMQYDRKIIDSGKPELGIVEHHQKPNGELGWSLTDKLLTRDESGNITGTIGFALDITDRKRVEEEIRTALAEKETLLRELYHRTKNNMQIISSMITLQNAYTNDKDTEVILKELQSKIQTMAMVHQKLYQSHNLTKIDLGDYITDLVDLLMESFSVSPDAVAPRLEMESVPVLIDTAIPLGLVLNELVSNSFKHAFKDGRRGELRVDLSRSEAGDIELVYADNGPGVPDGFDFRRQPTLGLETVIMITEHQLGGAVEFDGRHGLSCRIRFAETQFKERI